MVTNDVIPYGLVQAPRGVLDGLNLVGLKRRGVTRADITALRAAFQNAGAGRGHFPRRARRLGEENRQRLRARDRRLRSRRHRSPFSDAGLMLALIAGGGGLPQRVVSTLSDAPLVCAYEGTAPVGWSPILGSGLRRLAAFWSSFARAASRGFVSVARCAPRRLIRQSSMPRRCFGAGVPKGACRW